MFNGVTFPFVPIDFLLFHSFDKLSGFSLREWFIVSLKSFFSSSLSNSTIFPPTKKPTVPPTTVEIFFATPEPTFEPKYAPATDPII